MCYLGRADRGDKLTQVRLVEAGSPEETWEGSAAVDEPIGVRVQAAEAAQWVAQRAAKSPGGPGEIDLLCLDIDGASCAWLTAPSPDPAVVAAALAQAAGDGTPAGVWSPATGSDSSVQALAIAPVKAERNGLQVGLKRSSKAPVAVAGGERLAVMALPDVLGRLFIDELDDRGIAVGRAISFWHALGLAWDPVNAAPAGGRDIVATSAAVAAVVLIDPAGRLIWSWSRQGELLAAGTIKLAIDRSDRDLAVRVGAPEVARLTNDWLSWSVQLGLAPSRIVCLGPDMSGDDESAAARALQTRAGPRAAIVESLTPAALGSALGLAWPGATVDLAVHDDPIGVTLARLASSRVPVAPADNARISLVGLSRRPGRMHRSMYRWAAVAVFAAAVALLAVGIKAWGVASRAGSMATASREGMIQKVKSLAPPSSNTIEQVKAEQTPRVYLGEQLAKKRQAMDPTGGLDPAKPILAELETISYVLGTPDIQIEKISMLSSGPVINIIVPNTETGEGILAGLRDVGESHVQWRMEFSRSREAGKQGLTFYGMWKQPPGAGAAAPAGGRP